MNVAFTALALTGLVILMVKAPQDAFPAMLSGVANAVTLVVKLAAIYAVWLSILRMLEQTGLNKKLSKLLSPVIRRLFKGESDEAYDNIAVNLASNMLGMGGAATPAGIKAMSLMEDGGNKATHNMALLIIVNATSLQLVPATVIAIRAAAGSADASSIFWPTLIATSVSTLSGILLAKVFALKKDNPKQNKIKPLSIQNQHMKHGFGKMRRTK